jgi:hypothetical protein
MWGGVHYVTNGSWFSTNSPVPVPFCQERNWVALGDNFETGVRNQAGETWSFNSPLTAAPGPGTPIASLGRLLSSNATKSVRGPLYTTNWDYANYELRTNGTLWAAPVPWGWPQPGVQAGAMSRFRQRSDWTVLGGSFGTMVGMTSEGTLWTWGFDFSRQTHWTQIFEARLGIIKNVIGGLFGVRTGPTYANYSFSLSAYPLQKEPRPLMKLVFTNVLSSPDLDLNPSP